jgi:5-methylcytosine-specific restriction endonuclease McrBC GTP-binding regulatory subunit McrB
MNLSKVEMYFSDFLSIMESRTPDNQAGEPLSLHSLGEVQSTGMGSIPTTLHIPQNVFFTGTVNVDETTYMFSPKVLDRANVIEFNDVDLEGYLLNTKENDSFYFSNKDIRNELMNSSMQPFSSKQDYLKLKDIIGNDLDPLGELLIVLKKYNLHFGYRVINEISRFIWLSKEHLSDQFKLNDALDIQILQKILPKYHGTQAKLEQPLTDILSFCYENKPDASQELLDKATGFDEEARYPRSAQKVARMISNLKTQGYTSFIE